MKVKIQEEFLGRESADTLFYIYVQQGWLPLWEHFGTANTYEEALKVVELYSQQYKKLQTERRGKKLIKFVIDVDEYITTNR